MSYNSSINEEVTRTRINGVFNSLKKRFRIKRDNSLKGAYGETDYGKKIIRINVKKHKKKRKPKKNYPELADTILHEINHVKYPKKNEKQIKKMTKKKIKRISKKQRSKLYNSKTLIIKNER